MRQKRRYLPRERIEEIAAPEPEAGQPELPPPSPRRWGMELAVRLEQRADDGERLGDDRNSLLVLRALAELLRLADQERERVLMPKQIHKRHCRPGGNKP